MIGSWCSFRGRLTGEWCTACYFSILSLQQHHVTTFAWSCSLRRYYTRWYATACCAGGSDCCSSSRHRVVLWRPCMVLTADSGASSKQPCRSLAFDIRVCKVVFWLCVFLSDRYHCCKQVRCRRARAKAEQGTG
jgi:hypothetical protein